MKTFVLAIPPTPKSSTTHPDLAKKYATPVLITDSGAASGLQTLPRGRILITKSSFTTPNDIYLISGLVSLETKIRHSIDIVSFDGQATKLTNFTQAALDGKQMSVGEEFWFKGANNVDVQGWVLKPYGWRMGQKKKYPAMLAIHGGPHGAWTDQWWNIMNFNGWSVLSFGLVLIDIQWSPVKAILLWQSTLLEVLRLVKVRVSSRFFLSV